jgi:hypothetical protein
MSTPVLSTFFCTSSLIYRTPPAFVALEARVRTKVFWRFYWLKTMILIQPVYQQNPTHKVSPMKLIQEKEFDYRQRKKCLLQKQCKTLIEKCHTITNTPLEPISFFKRNLFEHLNPKIDPFINYPS